MFHLHSDPTRAIVVAGIMAALCQVRATHQGNTLQVHWLVATQFHKIVQHLSGIYYVL